VYVFIGPRTAIHSQDVQYFQYFSQRLYIIVFYKDIMKKYLIGGLFLITFVLTAPTIMKAQVAFSQKAVEPPGQTDKSPPPGFNQGLKKGWDPEDFPAHPPGFDQGVKEGWHPMEIPK
jgi:hypothetical protein